MALARKLSACAIDIPSSPKRRLVSLGSRLELVAQTTSSCEPAAIACACTTSSEPHTASLIERLLVSPWWNLYKHGEKLPQAAGNTAMGKAS